MVRAQEQRRERVLALALVRVLALVRMQRLEQVPPLALAQAQVRQWEPVR